jgi:hypothetical protein
MEPQTKQAAPADLRGRLDAIESTVVDGSYRPGPWRALVHDIRTSTRSEREAIAEQVSRVSRELHLRNRKRVLPMSTGIRLEIIAALIGASMIIAGIAMHSNALAFVGALLWMVTFEPLVKFAVGGLVGVEYDYMYLLGIEPRLKMRYGTYLAKPRLLRSLVHLSGTIGSPIAAGLAYVIVSHTLPGAAALCYGAFWILVAINVINFVLPLLGFRRVGPMPLSMSSAGSAAIEIKEGLGLD